MKKDEYRILFDITVLAEAEINKINRTGIYFCAINILKELEQKDDVTLSYYCDIKKISAVPCQYSIINDSSIARFLGNLWIILEQKRSYYKTKKKKILADVLAVSGILLGKVCDIISNFLSYDYNKYNVFFSIKYQIPNFIKKRSDIKKVIMLHDIIEILFPKYFHVKMQHIRKSWLRRLIASMNNEEIYIANTENTKQDFLKIRPDININRFHVIYPACGTTYVPYRNPEDINRIKKKYHIPENKQYFFSLCAIEPRKNLIRIIRTFVKFIQKNNITDMIMVMGGVAWNNFAQEFEQQIKDFDDFEKYILRVGYVEDDDLPILYSNATWFVYTSQYEGFGLPPLEAMSCGCPVIVSNNSSLPEVVGDAGILIDWNSDEQHIKSYEQLYFDKEYRTVLSQKGLIRAKNFSWKNFCNNFLDIISNELRK